MHESLNRHLPASLQTDFQRAVFLALAGSIALVQLSIAASQILLGCSIVGAALLFRRGQIVCKPLPQFTLPLAIFVVWTLTAVVASPLTRPGIGMVRKFYLFLILFLVPWILRSRDRILWVYRFSFVAAAISAAAGLYQYASDPSLRGLEPRIAGFMSHWMTFSGLLMLALVALSAYVMCIGLGKAAWVLPLGLLLIMALALSLTRSAWLGGVVGLGVVLLLMRPRAIGGLILVVLLLLMLSPGKIRDRFRTGLDPSDDNTQNRIELLQTSLRLIKAHPWLGVGGNVREEALRYRGTSRWPDWMYQHMHSNFTQIAAERGLPGLAIWLWLLGRLCLDAWRLRRASGGAPAPNAGRLQPNEALFASTAALGCCAALLVAGLFEYNFGKSEVLTFFLFIVSAPYALMNGNSKRTPGSGA